ncbi:hypothetical protein D9M72_402140 [compost metagenome]
MRAEDIARIRIAGVFDADRRVGADQQVGQQVQRLLCAHGDHDLVGAGPDAAARQHAGADLLHQRLVVAQDHVLGPVVDVEHAERLQAAFAPVGGGEQRGVVLAVDKGIRVVAPVGALDDIALLRGTEHEAPLPVGLAAARGHGLAAQRRHAADARAQDLWIDEIAAALARHQVAFIDQLLVRQHHGVARHAQLRGQLAAAWQRLALRQLLVKDRGHQHLADLALQAKTGQGVLLEQLEPHGGGGLEAHGAGQLNDTTRQLTALARRVAHQYLWRSGLGISASGTTGSAPRRNSCRAP